MSTLLRLSSLPLTLLSTYGAYNSYIAITNLQTYEATSKKLAEWSSEAAKQLNKTRTTQATAAVTILLSLATSLTLTLTPTSLPSPLTHAAPPALFVLVQLARNHVRNFWARSDGETVGMKVPLPNLERYNEAERATEEVLRVLGWVGVGWGVGVGVEVVEWVVGW